MMHFMVNSPLSSSIALTRTHSVDRDGVSGAVVLHLGPPLPLHYHGYHRANGPHCTPPTWTHLQMRHQYIFISNMWIKVSIKSFFWLTLSQRINMDSPKDHTSDLLLYFWNLITSGEDHLTGNLDPTELVYWSSRTNLQIQVGIFHFAEVLKSSDIGIRNTEELLLTLSFQNLISSPHYLQKPNNFLQPVKY